MHPSPTRIEPTQLSEFEAATPITIGEQYNDTINLEDNQDYFMFELSNYSNFRFNLTINELDSTDLIAFNLYKNFSNHRVSFYKVTYYDSFDIYTGMDYTMN